MAMNRMRARFGDFPNAELSFAEGMGMGGGADIDLVLRIDDISAGMATATEIRNLLDANIPELIETSINMNEGLPQVEVVVDRNRAFNLGLSMSGIAMEIAAAMNGVTATEFRYGGNEYPVVLELREEDRRSLADMERIFIQSNTGALIPVANFAELEMGLGPVSIRRLNQSRVINITGSLAPGASAHEVEQNIRALIEAEILLPDGITLTYAGQAGEINEMLQTFVIIFVLAILLVFGTMAGLYESFKTPFVNMFTIPLMLIGVVGIHIITGHSLSAMTMIGIVMLVGIVINNGIILVDYTNLLVGRGVPVNEACVQAGQARLRPVLMSALTTILGLVPLAFFPGQSAGFIQPIGIAVIGGLLSSTFITLFFIPVLYSVINARKSERVTESTEKLSRNEPVITEPVITGGEQMAFQGDAQ
jgi:HAE1 family hydrophobic/amphiphilic exporter-1